MAHGPSGHSDSFCKVLLELSQDHHFLVPMAAFGLRDFPTCHGVQAYGKRRSLQTGEAIFQFSREEN